ncbi:hypothetical protein [Haliangium sp.]|uniref:hypothetical protein n=1 Tax=Haliangium sp. TaxID=2663208 RepID=UPI003D0EBF31
MAELDVAIAAVEATTVSRDEIAQAMALWEPVWDVLVDREPARILALVLERVEYDGTQVALSFYPLGMAHLAAEAATMADGGGDEGLEEGEEAAA